MSVEPAPPSAANGCPSSHPRPQTVLLAEDDDNVREFVCTALEQSGYVVVAAPDGRTAGDLFAADPNQFDLVLTDVVMPHAIGPELAARVRGVRPDLPVLFMSGLPGGMGLTPEPLSPDERLLEKPFSVTTLLATVHELLGTGRG